MGGEKNHKLTAKKLWQQQPTADKNLDMVLCSVKNLPLRYWQENFFFKGAPGELWTVIPGSLKVFILISRSHLLQDFGLSVKSRSHVSLITIRQKTINDMEKALEL